MKFSALFTEVEMQQRYPINDFPDGLGCLSLSAAAILLAMLFCPNAHPQIPLANAVNVHRVNIAKPVLPLYETNVHGTLPGQLVGIDKNGFPADMAGPVSVRVYGAKGDGATDDTAAVKAAFAAATASHLAVYFPAGTYSINNATSFAGLDIDYSGRVFGDGTGLTTIACTSYANGCLRFENPSGLEISGMTVTETPVFALCNADTTSCQSHRNGSHLVAVEKGTNVTLHDLYLHDGASAGMAIDDVQNLDIHDVQVRRTYANAFYITDNSHVVLSNLTTQGTQDAAVEFTKFDSLPGLPTTNPCTDLVLTGLTSYNDFLGVLVNGCQHVRISNFTVRSTWCGAVWVGQDATTTTAISDDISISGGVIVDPNIGESSTCGAPPFMLLARTTRGTNSSHVSVSNVLIKGGNNVVSFGVAVDPTYWVRLSDISVLNPGGGCFDLGGGWVHANNLDCDNSPYWAFTIRTSIEFVGSQFRARNAPNTGSSPYALIVATGATPILSIDGADIISTLGKALASVEDGDAAGPHRFNNFRFWTSDGSSPTWVLPTNASASYRVNGGPELKMGAGAGFTGTKSVGGCVITYASGVVTAITGC